MASILPNGKTQFIDQNGAPLVGGQVFFYAPGTSNAQDTYQDSAATIKNTNPVQLDSRGQATIWGNGSYRQVVKDANGVTIWDQIVLAAVADAASSATLAGPGGAALVGLPDGGTLANAFSLNLSRVIDSIAALRATNHSFYQRAFVTGYYSAGDGGGGDYRYDPTDTTSTDNGGTVIVAADGGRWKLIPSGYISVRQFGAKGDGVTDDTAAIQSALNTVTGRLGLCDGYRYMCSRLTRTLSNLYLYGNSWIDFSNNAAYATAETDPLFKITGTANAPVAVSTYIQMGRKTLQIASTAGINANDVIEIYTPGNNGGFIDTSVIVNNGESCLVSYVIDGASLYLSDGVMDEGGYDPANGAVIRKWNTINDITIASDVKIKAKGRPQGSGYGDVGIVVFFGRNVNIHCSTYQVDQQSLRLESCYDCEASQMHIVVDPQNTNQNINYGIVYSGSSKHIRIHHNSCANMRHGIVSSHLSSLYGFYGVSRLIDIHHNQIWNTWHAGIATHNDTDRVTINNNLIQGCAFGVNLRERNAEIRSNRIAMCGQGVYLSAHPRNIRIVENVFEDSFGGAVTTSFDGVGDISDIVIEGNEVVRGVSGIQVTVLTQVGNGNRRFRIKNNVIESLSGSGGNDAAIRFTGVAYDVHIENNTITDIQNAGGIRTDNGGSRFIIKGNTVTGIATNAAISTVGTSYANSYGVGNIYQGNWTGASNLSNYSTFFNDNDNF